MEKKRKKRRRKKRGMPTVLKLLITVAFAIIVLFIFISIDQGKKKEPKIDPAAPAVEQLQAAWEIVGIRGENLQIVKTADGYDVSFDYKYPIGDETDFVGKSMGAYVAYCDYVYKETDFSGIKFYIFGNMIDQKGNSNKEKMFVMSMPKDAFLTYDWENLYLLPGTYAQIESDCSELFLTYGVRSRADYSKVYLVKP